ncbi:hypothetical protein OSB04_023211 [Centaurea solstitialis]|uniref:Uncharacterized protein n=1 Tax=Centaurea solstitialis TaxID=347529 RepID=A0AA38SKE0_9ASTR|nr:hypothetical protein OSB04_023211 [Centaurea solstitialis]
MLYMICPGIITFMVESKSSSKMYVSETAIVTLVPRIPTVHSKSASFGNDASFVQVPTSILVHLVFYCLRCDLLICRNLPMSETLNRCDDRMPVQSSVNPKPPQSTPPPPPPHHHFQRSVAGCLLHLHLTEICFQKPPQSTPLPPPSHCHKSPHHTSTSSTEICFLYGFFKTGSLKIGSTTLEQRNLIEPHTAPQHATANIKHTHRLFELIIEHVHDRIFRRGVLYHCLRVQLRFKVVGWGADGVIVGEAKSQEEGLKELAEFTKSLKAALL